MAEDAPWLQKVHTAAHDTKEAAAASVVVPHGRGTGGDSPPPPHAPPTAHVQPVGVGETVSPLLARFEAAVTALVQATARLNVVSAQILVALQAAQTPQATPPAEPPPQK